MLLLHVGNHVLFTSCFKDNFKICKTQCSDDKRLFDTMLLPALLLNIFLFVLTKYFMTSSQMFFCPALLLNQRVQLLTSSLKRGDQPEKSLCNINMWHRQRKGNRCMSGSKKIDVVFMKLKWFVDSVFRIAVSTYHKSLDQFSSPSLFLSGLCLEPPEELLNKNH